MQRRRFRLPVALLTVLVGSAGSGLAQGYTPPAPSYGYQPYNDRNPTGFNHPNNQGFGQYVYQPKFTGHRSSTLSYRRFKGY